MNIEKPTRLNPCFSRYNDYELDMRASEHGEYISYEDYMRLLKKYQNRGKRIKKLLAVIKRCRMLINRYRSRISEA